jgi:hypothetical protein
MYREYNIRFLSIRYDIDPKFDYLAGGVLGVGLPAPKFGSFEFIFIWN